MGAMEGRNLGLALLLLATACGSSSSAAGGAAGNTDSGAAGSAGATGSGGAVGLDAGGDAFVNPWADAGPIEAGVFDCEGMCCDGTTHYCRITYAGASPVFGAPPDAGAVCSDAGAATQCVPLPAGCAAAPSCACIGAQAPNATCSCDDQAGGITLKCYYP